MPPKDKHLPSAADSSTLQGDRHADQMGDFKADFKAEFNAGKHTGKNTGWNADKNTDKTSAVSNDVSTKTSAEKPGANASPFESQAKPSVPAGQLGKPQWLSTMIYRSDAVGDMSEDALQALLPAARARNRSEGITGMVVFKEGHYFQWLEGPEAGMARVWDSVSHDARHTNIAILSHQTTPSRLFGDFDMRLLSANKDRSGQIETGPWTEALPPALLLRPRQSIITALIGAQNPGAWLAPQPDDRAKALVAELLRADGTDDAALVERLRASAAPNDALFASVFEPAARRLGDLWSGDDCSEFEVTLALGRMHAMVRQLQSAGAQTTAPEQHAILVATQPGEPHLLGALLDASMLARAGVDVQIEFPQTDALLEAVVASTWLDVLDLTLSPAFARASSLPRMARTITRVRAAAMNKRMVVVVGGRAFYDASRAGNLVGADISSASSEQTLQLILLALAKARQRDDKSAQAR